MARGSRRIAPAGEDPAPLPREFWRIPIGIATTRYATKVGARRLGPPGTRRSRTPAPWGLPDEGPNMSALPSLLSPVHLAPLFLAVLPGAVEAQAGCGTKPQLEPIGVGSPGALGVPSLSAEGLPTIGGPLALRVDGAAPGGFGFFFFGPNELPIPLAAFGATLYPSGPLFSWSFPVDAGGGAVPMLLPASPPELCGASFVFQAVVLDVAALGGVAFTQGLRVGFGEPTGPLYGGGSSYATGANPQSVVAEDWNEDGVEDLLVANLGSGDLSLFLGQGGGAFAPAVSVPVSGGPVSLRAHDFDGDGHLDVVLVHLFPDEVSFLPGQGDGTFGALTTVATIPDVDYLTVGDLNGDGAADLVTSSYWSSSTAVLLGNGDGTFGTPVPGPGIVGPDALALEDLDGDGALDLVVADFWAGDVTVVLGNGDGTFGAPTSFPAGTAATELALGDFDGDGQLDVAVANLISDDVSILLGNGDGTIGAPTSYPTGDAVVDVGASDLDGNGTLDLVAASANSSEVTVYLGQGDGTFVAEPGLAVSGAPASVAITDLDGDGAKDLAVANDLYFASGNNVAVFLNELLE